MQANISCVRHDVGSFHITTVPLSSPLARGMSSPEARQDTGAPLLNFFRWASNCCLNSTPLSLCIVNTRIWPSDVPMHRQLFKQAMPRVQQATVDININDVMCAINRSLVGKGQRG